MSLKLSQFTINTNPADVDYVPILSVSTNEVARVTRTNFFANPPLGNVTATSLTSNSGITNTGPLTLNGSWDGWVGANESWAYASASTITVPTNALNKYSPGDYLKITQSSTVSWFQIISLTATVLTVAGITGNTVANSAITLPAYSKVLSPLGLPLSWIPYTPTFTNAGVGNGTIAAYYKMLDGKTIRFRGLFTLGTTSTIGTSVQMTLPITTSANYSVVNNIAETSMTPAGGQIYGKLNWLTSTTAGFYMPRADQVYLYPVTLTLTQPGGWGTGNQITWDGTYEAA